MKLRLAMLAAMLVTSFAAPADDDWTLQRLLDYAFDHNPDARIAQQRIAAAEAGLEQANAAFWPKVTLESSYTRTSNPMLVFGSILNQQSYSPSLDFNDVPAVDNFNVKGVVTMPIYSGGRNIAQRDYAQAATEAAKQDSAAIRNQLGFQVVRAFHTVLKTRQFIRARLR